MCAVCRVNNAALKRPKTFEQARAAPAADQAPAGDSERARADRPPHGDRGGRAARAGLQGLLLPRARERGPRHHHAAAPLPARRGRGARRLGRQGLDGPNPPPRPPEPAPRVRGRAPNFPRAGRSAPVLRAAARPARSRGSRRSLTNPPPLSAVSLRWGITRTRLLGCLLVVPRTVAHCCTIMQASVGIACAMRVLAALHHVADGCGR